MKPSRSFRVNEKKIDEGQCECFLLRDGFSALP